MFENIKVIGFDLDQTLYPKSPQIDEAIQTYLYERISETRGCSLEEAKDLFKNLYKNGSGLSGSQTLLALGLSNGKGLVQEALEKADIARFLSPNPEVIRLLEKLSKKFEGFDLLTGSAKEIALRKLEHLAIPLSLFKKIYTDEDGSKSDESLYHLWLAGYPHFSPANFLYIGDRVSSDYLVPKTLGIQSILVNISRPDKNVECPQLSSLLDLDQLFL